MLQGVCYSPDSLISQFSSRKLFSRGSYFPGCQLFSWKLLSQNLLSWNLLPRKLLSYNLLPRKLYPRMLVTFLEVIHPRLFFRMLLSKILFYMKFFSGNLLPRKFFFPIVYSVESYSPAIYSLGSPSPGSRVILQAVCLFSCEVSYSSQPQSRGPSRGPSHRRLPPRFRAACSFGYLRGVSRQGIQGLAREGSKGGSGLWRGDDEGILGVAA